MFHVKPPPGALDRVGAWLDTDFAEGVGEKLEAYAAWLADEGLRTGGIGPGELERIWDRHILDSLLFAKDLVAGTSVLDVGSGVGLPGIALAIVHEGPIVLLERSRRRSDALHRICAILEVHAEVVAADIADYTRQHGRVTMRASLTLEAARRVCPRLCLPAGELWFGLGRGAQSPALERWRSTAPVPGVAETLVAVPSGVLDSPAWLLRMTPT